MSQADQHSDLLFDFGPKGAADLPSLSPMSANSAAGGGALPAAGESILPTFDLASHGSLPQQFAGAASSTFSATSNSPRQGFWLDGDVLMCSCPECRAPMSVRVWLMIADCWNCGVLVELSDEQVREAERLLAHPTASPRATPQTTTKGAPSPRPPVKPTAAAPVGPAPPQTPVPVVAKPKPVAAKAPLAPARPPAPVLPSAPGPTSPKVGTPATYSPPRAPVQPPRATQPSAPAATRALDQEEGSLDILRAIFRDMPAWLISFIIHLALLMLLALIERPVEETGETITLTASVSSVVNPGGDPVTIAQTPEAKFDLPLPDKVDLENPQVREAIQAADQAARELRLDADSSDNQLADLDAVKQRIGSASGMRNGLAARDPRLRVEMVQREGGTTLTEAAVARALRWLQRHQNADGHWSLDHFQSDGKCSCSHEGAIDDDTAATSLALLPYLGAGQSHLVGVYKPEVSRGLRWLVRHQKPDGDLRTNVGNSGMYAHGQATIVLCEAFALTGDEELRGAAQKAADFIVQAQYHDGGWRYTPKPAAQEGDTSVVGWQLMALQSARGANLSVPEATFGRASAFLDRVQHRRGAQYGYQPRQGSTPVMTAEGLLCRVYLGWTKQERGLGEGVNFLLEHYPPRRSDLGIYYWYYATQTMHHYGGSAWEEWNHEMRDVLVESQQKEGHAAGSWSPVGQHSEVGGRIYMTSLAACTLEVYYRHLPVFRQIKVD